MKTNTWAELGRVTNYDFAKVRDLVVAGYTEVCQKGYDNFIAQVEVMHTSSDIDKLTITFWVMDSDGTPKPFRAEQEFYDLVNVPRFVSDEMAYKKKYEVRLTKQDLRNIHNERTFDVNNSHKDLGTIIRNRLYSMGVHQNDLSVEISDNALYYKVKVYAKDSLKLLFEMLTVTVEGLPLTVLEVLDSDHTVKVNI
jgi:hypothetical protein